MLSWRTCLAALICGVALDLWERWRYIACIGDCPRENCCVLAVLGSWVKAEKKQRVGMTEPSPGPDGQDK